MANCSHTHAHATSWRRLPDLDLCEISCDPNRLARALMVIKNSATVQLCSSFSRESSTAGTTESVLRVTTAGAVTCAEIRH